MQSINLSQELKQIIELITASMPVFDHIDTEKLQVLISRNRKRTSYGVVAKILGENEAPVGYRVSHFPEDKLYLIYFFWPRFFNHTFEERVNVICHELYHVDPGFDGTMRRFGSRVHGASKENYENGYRSQMKAFLEVAGEKLKKIDVLTLSSTQLAEKYKVNGDFYRLPRLVKK